MPRRRAGPGRLDTARKDMLEDEGVDFQTRSQLREIVRKQVRHQTNDGSWVYVRFHTASEPV